MQTRQQQKLEWLPYYDVYYERERHSISGNIKIAQNIYSPQLANERDILIYLPPSYEHSQSHYPVLYMHDGYNLFDEATSYTGEWHVDETMQQLAHDENLEAIVVGIPNMGVERLAEYSPFIDEKYGGGRGEDYLAFLVHMVKPLVDTSFRTLPNKRNTGLFGSSMGGLISLYGFFHHPAVFGFAGVMSPSLWFANSAIFEYLKQAPFQQGKIYLDAGTREMGGHWPDQAILRSRSRKYYGRVRRIKRILAKKGYRPTRNLLHIEDAGGGHNEAAWASRLPNAIRFFLGAPLKKVS
ncbi:alpha/beta hydrolase [Candidatus Leptofilum sp.]|uniref:alpha/beta hydrolase n=1 Tax=Candidatus Leptofilum sp. TaxID=3241576 RepID=UPI003B5A041A